MAGQLRNDMSVRRQACIVTVVGDVCRDRSTELLHAILAAVEDPHGPDVIVDMAAVTSFDDAALDALAGGGRAAQLLGGTLQIASPSAAFLDSIVQRLCQTGAGRRVLEVI
jgi:anti-anti-sigma regulatory factor